MGGFFGIKAKGRTLYREIVGGITTFLAMSYIIFVNPLILSGKPASMDFSGVMEATCVAAALATILMGLLANYPVGLAPGMGQNVFFAFVLCGAMGLSWPEALAAVFIGGVIFVGLSAFGFRSAVLNSIPKALKSAIAAGIGLLIAFFGLQMGGIVVDNPATFTEVPREFIVKGPATAAAVLTIIGLVVTMVLMAWRLRGAVLLGILITFAVACFWGGVAQPAAAATVPATQPTVLPLTHALPAGVFSLPGEGLSKVAGRFVFGFGSLFTQHPIGAVISALFVLFFMDLFDTVGTLVGVAQRANLLKPDGTLPRGERALLADAIGTCAGAALGTSTVTSYIESATGVSDGARTGLAALVTGVLFLVPLFFLPVVKLIGDGIPGTLLNPFLAPALIIVGAMMLATLKDVDFSRPSEYIPAFLTLIIIPLSWSISTGIMWGFISYAIIKPLSGKPKECPLLVYVFAGLFLANYTLIPWLGGLGAG